MNSILSDDFRLTFPNGSVQTKAEEGMESMHMMRMGQVKRLDGRDVVGQAKFVESLFGLVA